MTTGLAKLQILTEALPDFADMATTGQSGVVEIAMEAGVGFGFNLLNTPDIAVAKWFSSKGSKFQAHKHGEREFIIVYKGELHLTKNGQTSILGVGDFAVNESEEVHEAYFSEDTWYLAATIPSSKDWPV